MTTPTLFKESTWLVNTIEIRRDGSSDYFWVWHIIKDGRCMMEDGRFYNYAKNKTFIRIWHYQLTKKTCRVAS
jgi:hypothetical protein